MVHGLSCSAARGIFPDQGLNSHPLHWEADSLPLDHRGSPHNWCFVKKGKSGDRLAHRENARERHRETRVLCPDSPSQPSADTLISDFLVSRTLISDFLVSRTVRK